MRKRFLILPALYLAVMALSGCGGGGGAAAVTAQQATTTLTGTAAKGPIQAGAVKAFAVSFGAVDTSVPLAQGQTDNVGNYSLNIGSYHGLVLVEVTGGSFTDEVSGATVTLKAPLRAILANDTADPKSVAVTPLTELAFRRAKGAGALTADSVSSANAGVATAFGLNDIIATQPVAGSSDARQKKYAAACGSFSQLVNNGKSADESLDDALARTLSQLGDEQESSGGFSSATVSMINAAIAGFNSSGSNATGGAIDPLPVPASGLFKLATAGTSSVIAGIDVTVNLPAGVIVDADQITGEVTAGVVTISGVAAVGTRNMTVAKYTPASIGTPARLHVIMANVLGFNLGEFLTVRFDLTTGAAFPTANAFTVTGFSAKGLDGSGLTGITAAPASVAGL